MGNPSFNHEVQELRSAVEFLDDASKRVENWPDELHGVVTVEVQALVDRMRRLARQIEERPEGYRLSPGRDFANGAYVSVAEVPFPGIGVHLVYPNEGPWDPVTVRRLLQNPEPGDSMEIVAYLDTDDQRAIDRTLGALENVADSLGYADFEVVEEIRGSIFRRATSWLKSGVQSDEVALRLQQVEHAIHLGAIDLKQAEVDEMTARAVESLVSSVAEIPRVAMRAGSILFIKYQDGSDPVVMVRQLSSVELNALERHPGLQSEPESLLANLAVVIQQEALQPPAVGEG